MTDFTPVALVSESPRIVNVRNDLPANGLREFVAWLKANQRESGRWFTRSLFKDGRHFLSHAGSSMAVMALAACGELD